MPPETVVRVPIRRIPIVLDLGNPLSPELTLEDFCVLYGKEPDSGRFKVVTLEVITSPDDQQPMLVSECAKYSRFVRREADNIYFVRKIE